MMTWTKAYELTRFALKDTPPMSEPKMVMTTCTKCGTKILTEVSRSARCSICGMMFLPRIEMRDGPEDYDGHI
jgi:predicted RNA-binding Zn-ribbon protein involved in translation (DUF1610 family)